MNKPKNPSAVRLGRMAKGKPKRFSPEEIKKRTERIQKYNQSKTVKPETKGTKQ